MNNHNNDWKNPESASHYKPSNYLTPRRMASIGHQIRLLANHFSGSSIMEIGVGNGLTTQLLKEEGHEVTTFDIDPRLNPDIEGSITENDLSDEFVDTVLCCQVLEHIPWEKVPTALSQIHRVAKLGAVISVPNVTRVASIRYFSSKRASARQYRLPFFKRTGQDIKVQNDFHYWELGANKSEREFETLLEAQFNIKHSLRTYENLYHQFYVLTKN